METFKKTGAYAFENFDRGTFTASRTTDAEIPEIIRQVYQDFKYIAGPRTACGFKGLSKDRPGVIRATANPAKFPDTIISATGIESSDPSLGRLKSRPLVTHLLPADASAFRVYLDQHAV